MTVSLFLVLNICNTISSFSLSVIAPFFPTYAYSLGISSEVVGLIFAVQPLGAVISSLKVGVTLTKDNRMKFMEWGMFLQATCILIFVVAHMLNEYYSVILLTLLARVCNGAGYSMFVTAFYSMIPTMYPQTVESKIAMAETASSLGFMIAPILGSLLYSIGGFDLPFIVFSILSLLSGVYIHRLMEKPLQPEEIELSLVSDTQQLEIHDVQQVTYWYAIKYYTVLINVCITLAVSIQLTYSYPIIADYLIRQFHKSSESVGIFMSFNAFAYATSSYLLTLQKTPNKPKAIFIGLTIAGLSQFFYGPDEAFTGMKPNLIIYSIAVSVEGFAVAFAFIYSLPQVNECLYKIFPDNKDECNNIGSGLFSAAMSLGEFIGPLFAGWLREYYDYDRISSIIGIMMICISISYIPFLIKQYAM